MKRESWLPAVPDSAETARRIVREAAAERGLDGDAVWDLMLATTEAIANAVQHGRPCPDGNILLRIDQMDGGLFVEVSDCGSFRTRTSPRDDAGGRGLPIMNAVTDSFELTKDPGMTRVRFHKRAA